MTNKIKYFFESNRVLNPRLFLGMILIFIFTSSCSLFNRTADGNNKGERKKARKEKREKRKEERRRKQVMCYSVPYEEVAE